MKDAESWAGNSLALILAALAVAAGVIGLLVAFEYINDGAAEPFEDGMIWMISGVILAIAANAFRREHHVVDADVSKMQRQPLQGGAEAPGYERTTYVENEPRSGMRHEVTHEDTLDREDIRTRERRNR